LRSFIKQAGDTRQIKNMIHKDMVYTPAKYKVS